MNNEWSWTEHHTGIVYWRNAMCKLQRSNGPAIEYPDGHGDFYLDGELVNSFDVLGNTPDAFYRMFKQKNYP